MLAAAELYVAGNEQGAMAAIAPWRSKRGVALEVALAEELAQRDQPAAARRVVETALGADPDNWNGRVLLAELAEARGDKRTALATYRELNAERPKFEPLARVLAGLELKQGRGAVAAKVLERCEPTFASQLLLAKALYSAGRSEQALGVARPLVEYLEREARRGVLGGGVDPAEYREVQSLYEELVAETAGAEAVTVDAAMRGNLDARAAVNFTLLAGELMNQSGRIATTLELKSVEEYQRMGAALLETEPASAAGLCQLGIAALRSGAVSKALDHFEAARDADRKHFGALLGSGAARAIEQKGLWRAAKRLPAPQPFEGLTRIVPDWPVLTDLERRVVCASVAPLKTVLPVIAEGGGRMRILPIDVRVVDVPEFQELVKERAEDDHRSYAALGGVASGDHGVACARIESLLDTSAEGWTFAHEFAHVAHSLLEDEAQGRIASLWERAQDPGESFAFTQYQLSNPYEFFACAYVDSLLAQHGVRRDAEAEAPSRVAQQTLDFIARLGR